jgi:hypothetical protein
MQMQHDADSSSNAADVKPAPASHAQGTPGKHGGHSAGGSHGGHHPYLMLLVGTALSYAAMYFIMYSMADQPAHVYLNLSNVYMTGLMAGSMVPIMLLTMSRMFPDKRINVALWVGSAAALALCWFLLRAEAGVGDRQFMRAMIPHHSAAIQMAKESAISDPRLKKLTEEIISSQEREIAEMKTMLDERK